MKWSLWNKELQDGDQLLPYLSIRLHIKNNYAQLAQQKIRNGRSLTVLFELFKPAHTHT